MYHLRAIRAGRRWRPFRARVAEWLAAWRVRERELILIGPSAGYTLPTGWLAQFARVHAYDLDPAARWLFKLRHRGVRARFHRRDAFWRDGKLCADNLVRILAAHPGAAVLFSNVLGQVLLENTATEVEWTLFLENMRAALGRRSWASYHDRYTDEGLVTTDHLTGGAWTRGLRKHEFEWWLTPTSRHRIEAVCRVDSN